MGESRRKREAMMVAIRKELEKVAAEIQYAESHLSSLQQRRGNLRYRLMMLEDQACDSSRRLKPKTAQ